MFYFAIKNVPVYFVLLQQGAEIKADDLLNFLEEFYNEDFMFACDVDTRIADILVQEGILEKYEQIQHLYKKTDKFNDFYENFINEYNG